MNYFFDFLNQIEVITYRYIQGEIEFVFQQMKLFHHKTKNWQTILPQKKVTTQHWKVKKLR